MIDLLRKRRSIRKYLPKKIDTDKLKILKESLLRSPSSRSINPLRFIFIEEKNTLEKLSLSKKYGSSFLKGAPLGVIICADETKSDVWIEDASIASIIIQLTAESIQLHSCWIQIRNREYNEEISSEEYIKKNLNIPAGYRVESIIAIGYGDEEKDGWPEEKLLYDNIKIEKY